MKQVDAELFEFDDSLTKADAVRVARLPELRRVQTPKAVKESTWSLLNEHLFAARPDVELRVYHQVRDLRFTKHVPYVRRFAVDCHEGAEHLDAITAFPSLELLRLGIFDVTSFDVLNAISADLRELGLSATRKKNVDLAPIRRFRDLRVLYLEGHRKSIEAISELAALEDVTLRSISTPDITYVKPLSRLRSLDVKLGGIRDLCAIRDHESIRYLELWQVRGLADVSVVASLPSLQNLFLQSLLHVERLPSLEQSRALRRVHLESMKGLSDFGVFEGAPALEEFRLLDAGHCDPDDLLPVLRNPRLQRIDALFGSDRKNGAFARLRDAHGKQPLDARPFEYR